MRTKARQRILSDRSFTVVLELIRADVRHHITEHETSDAGQSVASGRLVVRVSRDVFAEIDATANATGMA